MSLLYHLLRLHCPLHLAALREHHRVAHDVGHDFAQIIRWNISLAGVFHHPTHGSA